MGPAGKDSLHPSSVVAMRARPFALVGAVLAIGLAVGFGLAVATTEDHHSSSTPAAGGPLPPETIQSAPSGPGNDVPLPLLPTGRATVVPASIASNCSVDVSAALQSWIDTTPDNATLSFAPHACYRVDGTLMFENRDRLRIEGNGATLRAFTVGNRTRAQVRIRTSRNITVQDLVVRGANPHAGATANAYVATLEAQHAFDLQGVTGVLLSHVQAYDLYGDFVYIGARRDQPSGDVTVSHSTFDRSGRQGISVTAGVNVAIADNSISGVARSLFDLEANTKSTKIRHILILRNITGAARNFWLANKGKDANIGDIRFVGNRMSQATGGLVFVYSTGDAARGPFVFEGNQLIANDAVSDEGSRGAFFFTNAHDVTITDNTVSFARGMTAIELRNSHDVVVARNHFSGQGTLLLPTEGSSDYRVS